MNAQELFSEVVTHQRKQMYQSVNDGGTACRYRGEYSRSCAFGCLISDEEYDPSMEGNRAAQLLEKYHNYPTLERFSTHLPLIQALQRVHDSSPNLDDWETGWREIAKEHSLTLPLKPEA